VRRVIQYLHTNLVLNKHKSIEDTDNYHHLLTFEDVKDDEGNIVKHGISDARSLLSLFTMAMFMNALDKRTYMPFARAGSPLTREESSLQRDMDLNAIPLIERRHCCYIRGLAFDLLAWFQAHYKLIAPVGHEAEPHLADLAPTVGAFGRHLVRYKERAAEAGIPGVCGVAAFKRQIEMSLFGFEGMDEEYKLAMDEEQTDEAEEQYRNGDLSFPFTRKGFHVIPYSTMEPLHTKITDYFKAGKNRADSKYFYALRGLHPDGETSSGNSEEDNSPSKEDVSSEEELLETLVKRRKV